MIFIFFKFEFKIFNNIRYNMNSYFENELEKIISKFQNNDEAELEYRFNFKNLENLMFEKIFNNLKENNIFYSIEQQVVIIYESRNKTFDTYRSIKQFKNGINLNNDINTLKKSLNKPLIFKSNVENILKLTLNINEEQPIIHIPSSLKIKLIRIKLRVSFSIKQLPNWRYDIDLVKNIGLENNNLKEYKNKLLFPIDIDNFISKIPYNLLDSITLESEYIGDKSLLNKENINDPINYIYNIITPNYNNIVNYQKYIYKIATYVIDNKYILNQFKSKSGFKRLSNNVLELNYNTYFNNVVPYITDYYLTDKIDGQRCLLYISYLDNDIDVKLISDKLYTINNKQSDNIEPNIILDAEFLYNGELIDVLDKSKLDLYVFDIILYDNINLSKEPFEERYAYFDKVNTFLKKHKLGKVKDFIKLSNNYEKEILNYYNNSLKQKYEIDGLIFTPNSNVINNNKKNANSNYINMIAYKWKPEEKLTIDFYIAKSLSKSNKEYILCSGISYNDYTKLNIQLIKDYYKIIPKKYHNNQYFPIPFTPSLNPNIYHYIHINNNDLTGKVGEFLYDKKNKKWVLQRIRTDRDVEVERGEYFGNAFRIAENIWLNIQNPLTINDLISKEHKNYFSSTSDEQYKAQRYFNSFVKTKIIETVIDNKLIDYNKKDWVIDLAAGNGQDLARLTDLGFKNGLFIDNDKSAIISLIERKHNLKLKTDNIMNIYVKNIDLTTPYTQIIKQFSDIPLNSADIIICNFAIHYLTNNDKNIKNIISLVYKLLKDNGRFLFTCFNGEKVFDLLKDTDKWNLRDNNVLKYSIQKKYKSNILTNNGQKIGVLLPFSNNEYYDEYLVNLDYVFNLCEKQGLLLELSNSFNTLLDRFKVENQKIYNQLTDNDKQFVSLYQYNILKKTKKKNPNNLINLLKINEIEIQGKSEINLILPIEFVNKCENSKNILFILPIRENEKKEQENKLLYIINHIKNNIQDIDYNICIVEQLYTSDYNKNKLYNIGVELFNSHKNKDYDTIVFIDINIHNITDNFNIYYKKCNNPVLVDTNYIFTKNKFELINGFSNKNNKVIDRLNYYKIPLITSNINIIISKNIIYDDDFKYDGLNNLEYELYEIIIKENIYRFIVDF